MPDLQRMGGVTGWLVAARAAADLGMDVSPHLFPEVQLHLLGGVAAPGPLEYVPWNAGLFAEPPEPAGGVLTASDRPGLGLEFHPAVFPA
jgi:mandelate racemase